MPKMSICCRERRRRRLNSNTLEDLCEIFSAHTSCLFAFEMRDREREGEGEGGGEREGREEGVRLERGGGRANASSMVENFMDGFICM